MDISDAEEQKAELERDLTERIHEFVEETGVSVTRLSLRTATQTDGTEHPVHVQTTVEVAPKP
jgi:hypothetical protein